MVLQAAAFFDMDKTLLRCNSGRLWINYLRRRGEMTRLQMIRALGWLAQYKFAVLDFEGMTKRVVAGMAGDDEAALEQKCRQWVADEVLPEVHRPARDAIERHRKDGELCIILSSSSRYVTEPLAEALGLDGVLCTRVEVEGGKFTGRIHSPVCYGRGKVYWAEQCAAEKQIDLASSWFYTDSYSDLPMLQRVGRRVVINPDPRLRRYAKRAGWTVEEWR
jgi:HAD superfamily hydrolase (TIGR01490 family)